KRRFTFKAARSSSSSCRRSTLRRLDISQLAPRLARHTHRMTPSTSEPKRALELVCPAGTLPALRAAVDQGADAVYIGFRGETNARNFPGLNFSTDEARAGIEYAHARGARIFVALNVYPSPSSWSA